MQSAFPFISEFERSSMNPIVPAPARSRRLNNEPKSLFAFRNGRRYHNVDSPYCLPCDLKELTRQALGQELTHALYGAVHFIEFTPESIPDKVLDIGCGSALWSATLASEFADMGRTDVEFTGVDLVPVYRDMTGINFKFVQHNIRNRLPFDDNQFDYVIVRDMNLSVPAQDMYADMTSEVLRVLKPGGRFEVQSSDLLIRRIQRTSAPLHAGCAYEITTTTQFNSKCENPFIQQWNDRIAKTLFKRNLPPLPCTLIGPSLTMEESIEGIQMKRLAVPLDDIWWESSPDNASSDSTSTSSPKRRSAGSENLETPANAAKQALRQRGSTTGTTTTPPHLPGIKNLSVSAGSIASSLVTEEGKGVRFLARLLLAQFIESLEVALREDNNIHLDEWDAWYKDLMWNWFEARGLRAGECLEYGVWMGRKAKKDEKHAR